MTRFKTAVTVAALGLMTLTACSEQVKDVTDKAGQVTDQAEEVAGDVTDKAGDVTGDVTDTVAGAKDKIAETADQAKNAVGELTGLAEGLPAFKDSATATLDAVKAGNFDTAKEEVTKLQDSWGKISEQVKEKSPETYTTVEEKVAALKSGLESDSPDADQLTTTVNDIIASVGNIKL